MIPRINSFNSPEDIGNRALNHLGAENTVVSILTDGTKNSLLLKSVYSRLRQAEIERNTWLFATRRASVRPVDATSMVWTPDTYNPATTYSVGAVVSYDDGYGLRLWHSAAPGNIGNAPGAGSSFWGNYFGPVIAQAFDATTSYFAGDLAYEIQTDGTFKVFLSLQSNNSDDPSATDAWDATVYYNKGAIVSFSAQNYVSNVDQNFALEPDTHATQWSTTASTGSFKWLLVGTSLQAFQILYPLNTGPTEQAETRNVYPLPYGYLRQCNQDPKAGSTNFLGAPSNRAYDDWVIENGFICTREVNPILLRFVADVTSVTRMSTMFCEGLGCRVALELCEPITQSTDKKRIVSGEYAKFMTEARLINAIENDAQEAALDDWIACRI